MNAKALVMGETFSMFTILDAGAGAGALGDADAEEGWGSGWSTLALSDDDSVAFEGNSSNNSNSFCSFFAYSSKKTVLKESSSFSGESSFVNLSVNADSLRVLSD